MEALGGKDKQLAELVDSSNAVFETFAKEDANLQSTLHLLPGALQQDGHALGKLAVASEQVGPALTKLDPFAKALGPAQHATKELALKTTPIIKNEIRPFAREILPTINELGPSTKAIGEAFPKLATSFSVLNEFFNELAYNPGRNKAGFDFFLAWANHDLNSVVSNADAQRDGRPQPDLLQLRNPEHPAGRRRSERNGRGADRAAQAAHQGRMRGASANARRARPAPSAGRRAAGRACSPGSAPARSRPARAQRSGTLRPPTRPRREAVADAEARADARQHPRDRPVRAQLLRAADVPVGVLRRAAAAESRRATG